MIPLLTENRFHKVSFQLTVFLVVNDSIDFPFFSLISFLFAREWISHSSVETLLGDSNHFPSGELPSVYLLHLNEINNKQIQHLH